MPRPRLEKPNGYDDGGKVLAEAMIRAEQPRSWALDLAKTLGYDGRDLDAWLRWYRHENYQSVWWMEQRRQRKAKKLEDLAQKLRAFQPDSEAS
jgi:hypothetical protein